ncbi:NAD(P)/FAD-dependent oxidoreductase [Hyphococcus luteus]|uniref:Aminoacetone oxidase family FAD-binding enzyme n=1 Tax=Hyphococcus luteus TaxID=2058213 RepID=A0A2S7K3F8_9PROT|nr:NAD(P)/FAD-dependent oxidoreductase [Marinicaulis flavus]PQA87040.1 aminoacetone oxidase family FAD-binding enzyme [Marinicaulis flavus]
MELFDVIIIGAGAAGMMAAIEAGRRGRRVLLIDHAAKPGEKIRISGGGRCNFTNIHAGAKNFISQNPHFCKSALKRFTAADFIARVDKRGVAWHEKALGQLFCDDSSRSIIEMLTDDCRAADVEMRLSTSVETVEKTEDGFTLATSGGAVACASLVIATGGKSIPKMGATDFAYRIARQFGLDIVEPRPALVPLTFTDGVLEETAPLSGVSTEACVSCNGMAFREALLFTHRGLSGPSILQISSYWREGDELSIDLAPETNVFAALKAARQENGKQAPQTVLAQLLPKRLADWIAQRAGAGPRLGDYSDAKLKTLAGAVTDWRVKPAGSEGWRTAEVTLGGVDTGALSSKTMEVKSVPGLYVIGEAVDVTGWLGGYNFQWAWSSGWAAGQAA